MTEKSFLAKVKSGKSFTAQVGRRTWRAEMLANGDFNVRSDDRQDDMTFITPELFVSEVQSITALENWK